MSDDAVLFLMLWFASSQILIHALVFFPKIRDDLFNSDQDPENVLWCVLIAYGVPLFALIVIIALGIIGAYLVTLQISGRLKNKGA